MVVSIYANLRYFVLAELLLGWVVGGGGGGGGREGGEGWVKREIKMINQNGFQNGLGCAYFPTYLSKTFRKIG